MDLTTFTNLVDQKVLEVRAKMARTWPNKQFPDFTWRWDSSLSGRIAGTASYWSKSFKLNPAYLAKNADELINETVPHEIGHLICKILYPYAKQHHGPEFRYVLRAMGYYQSARSCHNYDIDGLVKRRERFSVVCDDCGRKYEVTAFILNKLHTRRCRCGSGNLTKAVK